MECYEYIDETLDLIYKKLLWFLEFIDIFSTSITFRYRGSSRFKTISGGIFSVVLFISTLLFFISLSNSVFSKYQQKTFIYESYTIDNNKITRINSNFIPQPTSKSEISEGFFYWYFTFWNRTTSQLIPLNVVNQLVLIETFQVNYTYNNDNSYNINKVADSRHQPCSNILLNNEYFNNSEINDSLCFNKTRIDLQGDFKTKLMKFYSIQISPLSLDESKILQIKNIEFRLNYPDYRFDKNKINSNIYLSYFRKSKSFYYLSTRLQNVEMKIGVDNLYSEENIFISNSNLLFWNAVRVNKIETTFKNKLKMNFLTINVKYDRNYKYYYRRYSTIPSLLSQFCGFWTLFLLIGYFTIFKINTAIFWLSLSNSLFTIVDVTNEKKIKNYNYKYMSEKKIDVDNGNKYALYQKAIKLSNKTEIECDICFSYYKQDRHKGIYYNFYNIFHSLWCFCRSNEVKNNIKIIRLSKKETIKQLDLKKIFYFVFDMNQVLRFILEDKKDLLLLGNSKAIFHSKLNLLNEWYKKSEEIDKLDKLHSSLYKEVFFFEGLRSLKSKPILDEKLDVNLIKLLNLDPNSMKKYFIKHWHIFENQNLNGKIVVKKDSKKKVNNNKKSIRMKKIFHEEEKEDSISNSFDDREAKQKHIKAIQSFLKYTNI